MNFPAPDNFTEESFAAEKRELAEIDFSSLLDLPVFSPLQLSKEEKDLAANEKYVIFHLDEKLYGIRAENILEIVASLPITPLPNLPGWLTGIANLRGMIISVVNLRKLWKRSTLAPQKSRLIVFQAAENDISIAFTVDKVSDIVLLPTNEINFSAADFEHSFPTFFGKTVYKSQSLFLLDVDKILSSLKLDDSVVQ